jgi:hypothetical protein
MEGWVYVCAVLLVAAGFAKIRDTGPTEGALATASLPVGRTTVLALGVVEITAGLSALVVGGSVAAWVVAGLYAGFAGFVGVALLRSLPLQSCGCFGREDTPPTATHVVVNAAASLGAATVAVTGFPSLFDVMADQPLGGVPYLAFVGIGAFALYLLLAELPRLGARSARPS